MRNVNSRRCRHSSDLKPASEQALKTIGLSIHYSSCIQADGSRKSIWIGASFFVFASCSPLVNAGKIRWIFLLFSPLNWFNWTRLTLFVVCSLPKRRGEGKIIKNPTKCLEFMQANINLFVNPFFFFPFDPSWMLVVDIHPWKKNKNELNNPNWSNNQRTRLFWPWLLFSLLWCRWWRETSVFHKHQSKLLEFWSLWKSAPISREKV